MSQKKEKEKNKKEKNRTSKFAEKVTQFLIILSLLLLQ